MFSVRKFMRESRIICPVLLALAGVAFLSGRAVAGPAPVEIYAQQQIDRGIQILTDKSLSDAARKQAVEAFLQSVMDLDRVSRFVLGTASQSAPAADVAAFSDAFRKFTLANYESQLSAYDGQSLKVIGSTEHAANDYVVTADVVDRDAPANSPPTEVRFRILGQGNSFAVVDANVEGVWFEVAQRDAMQAYLEQNGRSVSKLVQHIGEMTSALASAN